MKKAHGVLLTFAVGAAGLLIAKELNYPAGFDAASDCTMDAPRRGDRLGGERPTSHTRRLPTNSG
jgi:hypothetical protein